MKENIKYIIISVVLAMVTFIVGFYISRMSGNVQNTAALGKNVGNEIGKYSFINQAVTLNIGKHFIINFKPLKQQIEAVQKQYSQKTYVYFLYLNNGSWIGLNELDNFTAASTVKVPLAMATYRAVEDGKIRLADSYTLEELDLNRGFGDLYQAGADNSFTIGELIKIMLENSDNTAQNAVFNALGKIGIDQPLTDVYQSFGWAFDIGQTPNFGKINLKTLSDMFVALYNAKYVSIGHSQQILEYLNNSPFKGKIVAGVPEDIPVAHKIGISEGDETFSDCGIVYAPNRNYLLCLGSNGGDEKKADKFMSEVSKAAYDYVIEN
ncbi:MAG: serine hydrolase [Minisyncoccia bacterium]